ncbi:MAG: hypothetical protein VW646_05275 [Hydrogenophilales bacterium]
MEFSFSQQLEIFFIVAILLVALYFHIKFDRFSVVHGPEVLTTMGIFGCFTGITIGLFGFDPNNIQDSVPSLLGGIRTAFGASLAGVFAALTIRFAQRFRKQKDEIESAPVRNATLDDVVSSLNFLNKGLLAGTESFANKSIIKSDELISEFKNFSSHMIENNQKVFIEALREVIKDFNEKITEQFGENFKALNAAVEKLVVWQQQYKDELDQLKETQSQVAKDLSNSADNLVKIVSSSTSFVDSANALKEQVDLLSNNREVLIAQQNSLESVLNNMSQITPTFEVKTAEMLKQIEDGMKIVPDSIVKILQDNSSLIKDEQKKIFESIDKSLSELQNNLSDGLRKNVDIVKESVLTLDKSLQKELNDSLESLGRQLASLSNRFVEDYGPLTDRLREVVQMSKRL